MFIVSVLFAILIIIAVLFAFFKKKYSYWKDRGIEYIEPLIPYGNTKPSFTNKSAIGEWVAEIYHTMKAKNVPHAGCYFLTSPIYFPIDLDLIKQIMQNDFVHFTDHRTFYNEKIDPLSANLFALQGQRWRDLRVKLTPTFTSGKMKLMFPIMTQIAEELIHTLSVECRLGPMEVKDISARFTTDVIGNCAFGIECNSLKDPNTEFRTKGNRIFGLTRWEVVLTLINFTFPKIMKRLGGRLTPKDAADFFWDVIKTTTDYRIKNNVRRNDALQLLIDMLDSGNQNSEKTTLTFSELAAQAFIFFAGGFETSSTLMCFALFELSLNDDVQNQLRKEVIEEFKRNNGKITYESLFEMRFLDMVINETLRKYPPIPILTRTCTKDYKVPNTDLLIEKDTDVFISTKGIHYDPEYYPDPEKFDPTRFTEENKNKRHHFAFLPVGEGPRICIGLRFGIMQAKVGIASLIANFKFKLNPKTELPLKFDPKNFLIGILGGVWMDVESV